MGVGLVSPRLIVIAGETFNPSVQEIPLRVKKA